MRTGLAFVLIASFGLVAVPSSVVSANSWHP